MSISNSAYVSFAALLATSGQPVSPAQLHGLLLGRSCAGAGFEADAWLEDAADLLGDQLPDNLRQALIGLQEMVRGELTGTDMAVVILLPPDEAELPERAAALGEWCQGFLDGFGMIIGDQALSAEAIEVLQDLASIAQVQSALEESEDGESDYMEVMEYLRVAPLLLFTECGKTAPAQSKPSIH
ncbi:MAG TPA: YecA family protein [Pseudomonas sp.]|nr:YecA family protein [Pseudomonas sp.]